MTIKQASIKAIIGLGNPGARFATTRHNIGFMVVDYLAEQYGGVWATTRISQEGTIMLNGTRLLLVKPQTFMNTSGLVIPELKKRGIAAENLVVVHDELELPFGSVKYRFGGSARGHNGLRSLIAACGESFGRLRCGIARPENKEEVPDYVLAPFAQSAQDVEAMVARAAVMIEEIVVGP